MKNAGAEQIYRGGEVAAHPGGKYLIAEPKIHTSNEYFESIIGMCKKVGFTVESNPIITFSRAVLLSKQKVV